MKRKIHVFDKKSELLKESFELKIPDEVLLNYYKESTETDPKLIYEYEILKKDEKFFKQYILIDFDFEKNDYFLSSSP